MGSMVHLDRIAVRFVLLALARSARVRVISIDDIGAAQAIVAHLPIDDLLRLGFGRFSAGWQIASRDQDAMCRLGCNLLRTVEWDTTLSAYSRGMA